MRLSFYGLLLALFPFSVFANYLTVQSGEWSDPQVWAGGQVPQLKEGETIILRHRVDVQKIRTLSIPNRSVLHLAVGAELIGGTELRFNGHHNGEVWLDGGALISADRIEFYGGEYVFSGHLRAREVEIGTHAELHLYRSVWLVRESIHQSGSNSTFQLANGRVATQSFYYRRGALVLDGGEFLLSGDMIIGDAAPVRITGCRLEVAQRLILDNKAALILDGRSAVRADQLSVAEAATIRGINQGGTLLHEHLLNHRIIPIICANGQRVLLSNEMSGTIDLKTGLR